MKNRGFEGLLVWQKARGLAVLVYRLTDNFPGSEAYNLTSQMRRAATSVMSNIAEGHGRDTRKDFVRFLYISRGSLMELHSCLVLASDLGHISEEDRDRITAEISQVGRMLNRLIESLAATYVVKESEGVIDGSFYQEPGAGS